MMSPEVAYCVGLFEGEGTVYAVRTYQRADKVKRARRTPVVRMLIVMTDREPLERVQSVLGGRLNGPHKHEGRKDSWTWSLATKDGVRVAIESMYPHLSPRRQRQIDEALS